MKAVLFDFHNTLATCDSWLDLEINTLPALVLDALWVDGILDGNVPSDRDKALSAFRTLRKQARESGVEVSAVEGTRRVLVELGYHVPEPALESAVAGLEKACLTDLRPVEGVLEILQRLRDVGYTMGVVSSAGWPPFVEMALEMEGMRPFFSAVLTSAGEGIYKSDPEIFRRACGRLGVAPGETVHVGDHARYDVVTARAAGLHTVWFNAHAHRTAHLHNVDWDELEREGSQADAVIDSLYDLPAAVVAAFE